MKAWDQMWKKFDEMMSLLPDAISDFQGTHSYSCSSLDMKDGVVHICGRVDKLVINGYTIRLPEKVTNGRR